MKKSVLILACLFVFVGFVIADEWKVVGGSEDSQARVLGAGQELKIEITVPSYQLRNVEIDGKNCVVVSMPGASWHMLRGYPLVPQLTRLVKIPHNGEVHMRVLSVEEEEVTLTAPIIPSKGHFTRDIPYESVPFEFGPIYRQNVFWLSAEEQFQIGEPFMFRDVRGVRIQILPIRANHVTMKMKVLKKAVILLTFEGGERTVSAESTVVPSRTFSRFYQENFLNYSAPQTERGGTVPPESNRKLVVITPAEFEGLLGTWVEWKRKAGYEVTVKSFPSGTVAGTIKTYLQGLYDNAATRFGYVVLIGDAGYVSNFEQAQPMPTFKGKYEGAAADRVYVRLAGNDNYPDAFISRVSGNADQITLQLNKFINYEKSNNGAWLAKGICIASNQGSPTDRERAEWIQNGGGSGQKVPVDDGGLLKFGYTAFDDIYDPTASAAQVTNAVNSGRGIICYIGHGSSTSWGTTGFSVSQAKALTNGAQLPHIWSVACVNGDFVKTAECFAEAWLRAPNGGAIAMEAASTNEAWVPPCDKQTTVVNAIIRKSFFTFGALEAAGCVKGLEVWGDTDKGQGNQMAEQCNLFGDCTILLKTKEQASIAVQVSRDQARNASFVVNAEGRAQANATVTVYTSDLSYTVSSDTDDAGTASLNLETAPNAPLFYTVVGPDLIPVIDQPLN